MSEIMKWSMARFALVMAQFAVLILGVWATSALAAPPHVAFPCPTGSPLPTQCRIVVNGGAAVTVPPHKGADGKTYCVADIGGLTGVVTINATPVNVWGAAAPTTAGPYTMSDFSPPGVLGAPVVLPALP